MELNIKGIGMVIVIFALIFWAGFKAHENLTNEVKPVEAKCPATTVVEKPKEEPTPIVEVTPKEEAIETNAPEEDQVEEVETYAPSVEEVTGYSNEEVEEIFNPSKEEGIIDIDEANERLDEKKVEMKNDLISLGFSEETTYCMVDNKILYSSVGSQVVKALLSCFMSCKEWQLVPNILENEKLLTEEIEVAVKDMISKTCNNSESEQKTNLSR